MVTRSKLQHEDRLVFDKLNVQTQLFVFFLINYQKKPLFLPQKKAFYRRIYQGVSPLSGMPVTHHVGGKDENTFMFSTGPLRIIQKIWIILCSFSSFTS